MRAFFLLLDRPEVYNLPLAPHLPSTRMKKSLGAGIALSAVFAAAAAFIWAGEKSREARKGGDRGDPSKTPRK